MAILTHTTWNTFYSAAIVEVFPASAVVGSYLNLTIAAWALVIAELRTDGVLGSCSRGSHTTIVLGWIEAFNKRDLEAEADILAPGYVAQAPTAARSRASRRPARK